MSDADRPDPNDPVLFPKLTADQLARLTAHAERREFAAGDRLFDQGDRDAPVFVLESGAVEVRFCRPDGETAVARVATGGIIGDTAMFTGQPTVAGCVATGPSVALMIPPERLRPLLAAQSDLGDLLLNAFVGRRAWLEGHGYGQATLIGPADSQETYRLRAFLARNQVPVRWLDPSAADTAALMARLGVEADTCPVLVCGRTNTVKCRPTIEKRAEHLGLRPDPGDDEYDFLVVGAGPAGLAAAVYGASEGLNTLVLEGDCPGGQAGTSSKIENYLGFLTGISGAELTRQATLQARKFGAVLSNPWAVRKLCGNGDRRAVELADGRRVKAKTVLIATGAEYRRLTCPSCGDYEGRGVYYAASHVEAVNCADQELAVVGGGNSAGQAVVFLAGKAKKVTLIVRRDGLAATMSKYLSDRVESLPNVEVVTDAEVTHLRGDVRLSEIEVRVGKETRTLAVAGLFVLIGADPRADWLDGAVLRDAKGFVLTGDELRHDSRFAEAWPLDRDPYLLETSVPGVFAAGDVRSGSVKRVAAAVGEGSMAVSFAHRRIAELAGG